MSDETTTLITGGSGGIGLEMARLLAARGHRLVLASRDAGRLEAAASELRRAHGAEVLVFAVDLSEPGAAQRVFEHTQHQGLRIDVLVNNAGFGVVEEHVAIDVAQLQRMLQLDVLAVAELCHRYGGEMKRRRRVQSRPHQAGDSHEAGGFRRHGVDWWACRSERARPGP